VVSVRLDYSYPAMSDTKWGVPASRYSVSGSSPLRRRQAPWAWLILWSIGVALLSLLPLHLKRAIGTTGQLHDLGHVVAFAITSVLFLRCNRQGGWAVWRLWPVLAFAVILEALESILYSNVFEWSDIGVDTLGMVAGLLAYHLSRARITRRPR